MVTCSVASDLHLEFGDCKLEGGDLLFLLGDTIVADSLREVRTDATARSDKKRFRRFFAEEARKYSNVYVIGGNHEHYHGVLTDTPELYRDFLSKFAPNARYMDNEYVEIDGVRFVFSTLWATYGCGTDKHALIQNGLNDFRLIWVPEEDDYSSFSTRKFTVEDANKLHQTSLAFIKDAIQTELPCVVMTHHAPTYLACNRKRYPNGDLDDAYASNQSELILDNPQIKLWFSGHSHYSFRTQIGETKLAANCRGYYGHERESLHFKSTGADFDLATLEFVE